MSASKPKAIRKRHYIPTFEGEIEGWTHNFLSGNLWRVARTKDRDDCMQEARLVFLHVADRYRDVNDPAHFQALYMTSYRRRFTDFSHDDTRLRELEVLTDRRERIAEPMGDTCNEGELRVMIRQAPREVRMVLELVLRAPQEILDVVTAGWRDHRSRNGISADASERINALLGLPSDMNTLERVRDYFQP